MTRPIKNHAGFWPVERFFDAFALDLRFKTSEIICYSDRWACLGMRDTNYCGSQVAPGLFKLVDISACDPSFIVDTAMPCFERVKRIHKAAGTSESLERDFLQAEHAWGGSKSESFFKKHPDF
ncbi:MAG: hypothetical protein R6X19_05360 [Kiritimatiellia bacterium]